MRSTSCCTFRTAGAGWLLAVMSAAGCSNYHLERRIVQPIEQAHGLAQLPKDRALAFDLDAELGLAAPWHAHMVCTTNGSRVRADLPGDARLVFDGHHTWFDPDAVQFDPRQCDPRRWALDVLLPLRLHDANVRLRWLGELPFRDRSLPAAKIVDASTETGGPADARIVYVDPTTGRVFAIASEQPSGNDVPYTITFTDVATIEGVTIGTKWEIWPWKRDTGPHGDFIGVATLTNLAFVHPQDNTFALPPNARQLDGAVQPASE